MSTSTENNEDLTQPTNAALMGDIVDVTIHPLVLLSAADHYHRVALGTRKRVVGALLGTVSRSRVDATNSFAVPFEEDAKNPNVFYLDHNYLENMLAMFRKVNAKERLVGFYSTGPQIRENDLRIYGMMSRFLPANSVTPPVFCIIDVRPDRKAMPTTAYKIVEKVEDSNGSSASGSSSSSNNNSGKTEVKKTFAHVPSMIGAMEAEEVGVEHLLRDINDPTVSTIASLIQGKMSGLATLADKLLEMKNYLTHVVDGKIKPSQEIIGNMQGILNLLPNLNVEELVRAMLVKTNDLQMAIYLSSLIRSVIALHDLLNNMIRFNEATIIPFEDEVVSKIKTTGNGQDIDMASSDSEEKKQ